MIRYRLYIIRCIFEDFTMIYRFWQFQLFDPENTQTRQATIKACEQIVNCLVQQILKPELKTNPNIVNSCLLTLYLFCKSHPKLLVPHGATLSPYLTSKINTQNDTLITQNVCKILELVVPLMEHPNPKFLAELEEDSMKLMLKQSQAVVQCSASCLASIINNVTRNFKFIVDAFNKFYSKFLFFNSRIIFLFYLKYLILILLS